MSVPKINVENFFSRLTKLCTSWKDGRGEGASWAGTGAVLVLAGTVDEDIMYQKTTALQSWLFGYEIPELLVLFLDEAVHFLASGKKAGMMQALADATRPKDSTSVKLVIHTRNKKDKDAENFKTILAALKASPHKGTLGVVTKELPKQQGNFADAFRTAITAADIKQSDLTAAFADLLITKDTKELELVHSAASLTNAVMSKYFIPQVESIVDEGKSMSHVKLAERTENQFGEPGKWNLRLDADYCDSCFTPIIQTGGQYDLRASAQSDENSKIHFGTILARFGARYKSYCTGVGRTIFINPKDAHKKAYAAIQGLHAAVLEKMTVGTGLDEIYASAQAHIADKCPEYKDHFLKSIGFGTGLEYRESKYVIDAKHSAKLKPGMVFYLCLGFQNLDNPDGQSKRSRNFAVLLADTVEIQAEGAPKVLTEGKTSFDDMSYTIDDSQTNGDAKSSRRGQAEEAKGKGVILDEKTRGEKAEDIERKRHQLELARKNRAEASARFAAEATARAKESNASLGRKRITAIQTYQSPSRYPQGAPVTQIKVDMAKEAVLVPINNQLVPFHVRTIKRVHKDEQGDQTMLYITFHTPGTGVGAMTFEDEQKIFVKELTFRAQDPTNFNLVHRNINELRKRLNAEEKEKQEKASTIKQDPLQLCKTEKNPRMANVSLRPQISGRRSTGVLEAHTNGFRFTSQKGEKVDILYKNIRNAFFQPALKELHVLIHFHLWYPIMVGKKRQKDIQIFTEVVDASQDLDKSRRTGGYDFDELEQEESERRMKKQLNTLFQNFAKKCEDVIERRSPDKVEFDMTYPDLGFYGVPNKTTVHLEPTVNCLVELHEPPFFVLNLTDVEIVHLERVQFSNKNFDMAFVRKDYSLPVVPVTMVPMKDLDAVKAWINSCNLKYYEGPAALNWTQIMNTIRKDPVAFHEDGGWAFLDTNAGDDGEGSGSDQEEESEYEPDDDSSVEEEAESEDYSYDDEGDESEYGEGDEDLSEEGMDWSDLEEEAEREDRKRPGDHDTPKKKKRRR